MKSVLTANAGSASAFIARLFLAIVVFPHGAQKLLARFGGHGFPGSMDSLTQDAGLPSISPFWLSLLNSLLLFL